MGSIEQFGLYLNFCFVITQISMVVGFSTNLGSDYPWNIDGILHPSEPRREGELTDSHRHRLVNAMIYHGRTKRHISTTLEQEGIHTNHIEVTINIDGTVLTLDLTLNKKLIAKGFFHNYQRNGISETIIPSKSQTNLCEYTGKVRGVQNSWVSLSTCDGLSGVIFDGDELHHIAKEASEDSSTQFSHFLYTHSNLDESKATSGYEESGDHEHEYFDEILSRHKRFANQTKVSRGPYNANEESRYLELVLVLDNGEYKEHGESLQNTLNYAKNIANIVYALFSRLNIYVALVGVVIWNEHDEIKLSTHDGAVLSDFLYYRREELLKIYPNDNAQLITKQKFENGIIVKSIFYSPMCSFLFSGGVISDVLPTVGVISTVVAQSIAHNFGILPDFGFSECQCPKGTCVMASPMKPAIDWSNCSVDYLKKAFSYGIDHCLKNKPELLFDGPMCGNGFVEPGEQCDCGLPEYCENSCCDAETCTWRGNVTCASGECCDYKTCSLKTAGTLCRSAKSECDLPEYCTGTEDTCPMDYYKLDAEFCDGIDAYCYQGSCKTRTDQCKLLWGESGKSSENECYQLNTQGNRKGDCGYNRTENTYTECTTESILCGRLQCQNLENKLQYGMQYLAKISESSITKHGKTLACHTAIIDLGLDQMDPGLTPNGAACGPDQMCVNQKCVSVSEIRNQSQTCHQDCNGNGWCNNMGNCHCKDGYAPPYCDSIGFGGSIDSGPATDPRASWENYSTTATPSTVSFNNILLNFNGSSGTSNVAQAELLYISVLLLLQQL